MGRFVFLQNTVSLPSAVARPPKGHAIRIVDQYSLTAETLDDADGLLLSQHLDERHLAENRKVLDGFLDRGGAIAVNGPVARPYVDGLATYQPVANARRDDWLLEVAATHPITEGVAAEDLSFRKGVVGFWARGCFPIPAGAIVLTMLMSSGAGADFIWHRPAGGRLFVHPGNDVWGYADDTTTAAEVYPQLLDWMEARA